MRAQVVAKGEVLALLLATRLAEMHVMGRRPFRRDDEERVDAIELAEIDMVDAQRPLPQPRAQPTRLCGEGGRPGRIVGNEAHHGTGA